MGVTYTDEQRACIESLVGPVDVSAGAGSGKTFTLTQRIASALSDPDSGVEDIDQICAITFTEKAAAELKGRIRTTLRAKGLFDQALRVDGAWISTIHGMCARILRAHALELGIDPAFTVMGEGEYGRLLDECLDQVLREEAQGARCFDELSRAVPVSAGAFGDSIGSLVRNLLSASVGLENGPRDLARCGQKAPSVGSLARCLLGSYEALVPQLESQKEGKQRDEALNCALLGADEMRAFLESGDESLESFLKVLDRLKYVRKLTGKAIKPACEEHLANHYEVVRKVSMMWNEQLADQLVELSCRVDALIQKEKQARGALDNNDLVVRTMYALRIPSISADYTHRFRLVMVDEFQDTDQVQLDIVSRLAGPGMRYLCTVGDAQQSIYGFRGADIQVYRDYQKGLDDPRLKEGGAQPKHLLLSKNFRSHADVLAFVRSVCQQSRVFGGEFLDLEPTYDGSGYKAADPRINVFVSAASSKGDCNKLEHARAVQALQIAEYFKRMADAGHRLSDMVLLLGSMTHAGEYAAAIRRMVGPCIVTGGSTFASAPEVSVVNSLLGAIVNPHDTKMLFAALSSEAFVLGARDYVRLSTCWNAEEKAARRCGLDRGLELDFDDPLGAASEQLSHAVSVMRKARASVRKAPLHRVLLQAVQDSGWILRLKEQGAEGLSRAGNVLKAIRLVKRLEEEECTGPASVAFAFRQELGVLRDSPGALNVGNQEAVRIMTVHASKGLEFPIVALADFDRAYSANSLVTRKIEGVPYMSLRASMGSVLGQDKVKKAFDALSFEDVGGPADQLSADALHARLNDEAAAAEQEERQRLFYVGVTRAKEALGVFIALKETKGGLVAGDGVAGDVCFALFNDVAFPPESEAVPFDDGRCLNYAVRFAGEGASFEEQGEPLAQEDTSEALPVPEVRPFDWGVSRVAKKDPTHLFSYSSFSAKLHDEQPQSARPVLEVGLEEEMLVERPETRDRDKATDFGSALHRLAQIAALQGFETARARVSALCKTYGVRDEARLNAALERWLSSEECRQAYSYSTVQAELPFGIPVGQLVMEGEIDLMCTNLGDYSHALVVDYKTGGHPEETLEQLEEKHGLQARCYAYAVLSQGYEAVDLVFYRVEQGNSVSFAFTRDDLPQLEEVLLPACELMG